MSCACICAHCRYESVWEGDSFVIAFHTPADALAFAMAVQAALLHLPWPSELLQSTYAKEVWCAPMAPSPRRRPTKQVSLMKQQLQLSGRMGGIAALRPASNCGYNESPPPSALTVSDSVFGRATDSGTTETEKTTSNSNSHTAAIITDRQIQQSFAALWQAQWKECATSAPGAVLAYRGLRVRLGMHAGVDGSTVVTFNTVMQRYHYTGAVHGHTCMSVRTTGASPCSATMQCCMHVKQSLLCARHMHAGSVRVVSNGVASAGHGGQILLTTATAELLGPDERGILHQLPSQCKLYHQGCHKLNGVEEDTDILLAVPDAFKCRLALQQAPLRSMIIRSPGVSAAPAPAAGTMEAADSTALLCIQFTGLPSLLAWDKQTTLAAAADAMTCSYEVLQDYGGVICQDGLRKSLLASLASGAATSQSKSSIEAGRVVISMDPHCHDSWLLPPAQLLGAHVAVEAALALRAELLQLDWSSELLTHELAEPVGLATDAESNPMRTCVITYDPHQSGSFATDSELLQVEEHSVHSLTSRSEHPSSSNDVTFQSTSTPRRLGQTVPATETDHLSATSQTGPKSLTDLSTPTKVSFAGSGSVQAAGRPRLAPSKSKSSLGRGSRVMVEGRSRPSVTSEASSHGPPSKRARAKHDVFDTIGLRGLRCKIAVVAARGAGVEIVTRGSGRVAYTGAPVKRVKKLLDTARVGQILVDHALRVSP